MMTNIQVPCKSHHRNHTHRIDHILMGPQSHNKWPDHPDCSTDHQTVLILLCQTREAKPKTTLTLAFS